MLIDQLIAFGNCWW